MTLAFNFSSLEQLLNSASPAIVPLSSRPELNDVFASLLSGGLDNLGLDENGKLRCGRRQIAGIGDTPVHRHRARTRKERERCIAVLDTETDPFDNVLRVQVFPFLAVLYSDQFEPIIIWDEDRDKFIDAVIEAIASLPDEYTIYAHNGGKFDFMFLLKKFRGHVKFKGRGIMSCSIPSNNGERSHELRDSMHIIPEALAGWKKDEFDYEKNLKHKRHIHRDDIIKYCLNDCKYLLQIIRKFVDKHHMKLSIGQAAMTGIRKEYKFECLGELMDGKIRGVNFDSRDKENYGKPTGTGYFFGGLVACLAGRGRFKGPWKLFDVNSMYPYVMATFRHPIGASFTFRNGVPDDYTAFVHVRCRNNGALIRRNDIGETTANIEFGEFYTTIWEFDAALELGLISDVKILRCVDCNAFTDFSRFVLPLYDGRIITKGKLEEFHKQGITGKSNHFEYDDTKLDDMILKFESNNAYGKFAQNPRKYKDHYFCDVEGEPQNEQYGKWGEFPSFKNGEYSIWERKAYKWSDTEERYIWDRPPRFYNVGTGASITGAARAILMRAKHKAIEPIYCDTDSIICRELPGLDIDHKRLGAWKLEKTFDEVLIAGKKEYAAKVSGLPDGHKDRIIIKSKGVDGVTWAEMLDLVGGKEIVKTLKGPTLTRYGDQVYIDRKIRATVPVFEGINHGNTF